MSNRIVELEIITGSDDVVELNKLSGIAREIYNTALNYSIKALNRMRNLRAYRDACLIKPDGNKKLIDKRNALFNEAREESGFNKYAIQKLVIQCRNHFNNKLGSLETQVISDRAFNAVQKIAFGKAKNVRFIKRGEFVTIGNKSNKSGIRYKDGLVILHKNKALKLKEPNAYQENILSNSRIKFVSIIKKVIRGKDRYFVQLTVDCFLIHEKTKALDVGLDIGVSTIAISSDKEVDLIELYKLSDKVLNKIKRLDFIMESIRRDNNPDNYNEDGTMKKGPKKWFYSNHYNKLKNKRINLFRKETVKRKQAYNILAKRIIKLGSIIKVEKMSFSGLSKRTKETKLTDKVITTKNGNTVTKYESKKRYGRTINMTAPALLLEIINLKLSYQGKSLLKIKTSKVKASQYNHITNSYKKKSLDCRHNIIKNKKVQRDLYSAFIIRNVIVDDKLDKIDKLKCDYRYSEFKEQHDRLIVNMRRENKLNWYVNF